MATRNYLFQEAAGQPRRPPAFDREQYKDRNTVATRYGKREFMYQGTIDLACIRMWLRDRVP
jgi:hypothetical protein